MDGEEAEDTAAPAESLTPAQLLQTCQVVNIAAPMVRYSKLPFRMLVSQYDTHITHTPMMIAREFSRSAKARAADFSTNSVERGTFDMLEVGGSSKEDCYTDTLEPRTLTKERRRRVRGCLVAQFAAKDHVHLADAAELISPYVDAIDINCGCPQKWAYQEEIGCFLLRRPETVRELIRGVKSRLGEKYPVHVKIRVDPDLKYTEQLVQTAVHAGADVLSVHGRTRFQKSGRDPVQLYDVKFAVECARNAVPVVANGDVFTLDDAINTRRVTGVNGVMSARGLLANPALFSGFTQTPLEAVQSFIDISTDVGLLFPLFHHHVSYMLEKHLRLKSGNFPELLSSNANVEQTAPISIHWGLMPVLSIHSDQRNLSPEDIIKSSLLFAYAATNRMLALGSFNASGFSLTAKGNTQQASIPNTLVSKEPPRNLLQEVLLVAYLDSVSISMAGFFFLMYADFEFQSI